MTENPYMINKFPNAVVTWEDEIVVYDGDVVTYNLPIQDLG